MRYGSLFDPFTGKETITDAEKKKFLRSVAYRNMIRKMVVGLTGDHKLIVGLLPAEHPELAFTDGRKIMVNTLHPLFADEPIEHIAKYCLALAVHEALHPMYSCFQCIQDAARKRANETDNMVSVRRNVFNILEDSRIERIGKFKFPGVSYAIIDLNEYLYASAEEQSDASELDILMQTLLDFVSVDKIKKPLENELGEVWEKIRPLATKAKFSDTCGDCYRYTKKIMKLLKEFVPETDPVERQQMMPINLLGNLVDVNAGTGQKPGIVIMMPGAGGKGGSSGADEGGDKTEGSDCSGNGSNPSGNTNSPGGKGQGGKQEASEEDKQVNAALLQMLIQALNQSYKEHEQDQSDDSSDSKVASEICQESENGYHIRTSFGTYNDLDDYMDLKTDVAPITGALKKGLKNLLNYNVDEVSRYQHRGRVDGKSVSRLPSGAIFSRRIEKSEETDLNITVLVDLSGSMSGDRMINSQKACVVLQEVCRELKIPINVLGFTDGRETEITHFTSPRLKGRFAHTGIVHMEATGGTPLAQSLMYLAKFVKKQKEEDKLVIVITDGCPAGGPEYSKNAVVNVEKHAKVYGMAIGDGHQILERIFGTRYIGVDTLEQMPRELCKIIEKNLFRR